MFGLEGGQESFGNLVGFPQTGTRVVWVVEGGKRLQRGYYRGSADNSGTAGTPWQHPGTGYGRYTGPHLAEMGVPARVRAFSPWGNFWF